MNPEQTKNDPVYAKRGDKRGENRPKIAGNGKATGKQRGGGARKTKRAARLGKNRTLIKEFRFVRKKRLQQGGREAHGKKGCNGILGGWRGMKTNAC